MFGLAVLVVGVIYLVVLLAVTRIAFVGAKRRGYSKSKCWLAAAVGFLIVYLPVFWDHIPTMIANEYYCSTQAGFTVYKNVEQWVAENPVAEKALTWSEISPDETLPDGTTRIFLNERFVSETHRRLPIPLLSTQISERVIKDIKTGEVIARHLSVGSGFRGSADWRQLKFWLNGGCLAMYNEFGLFQTRAKRLGEKK